MKGRTTKLLEESIEDYLHNNTIYKYFLNRTLKLLTITIDKFDFIRIKNVCSLKNTIERMKMQATNWEKILSVCTFDKGLRYKSIRKK